MSLPHHPRSDEVEQLLRNARLRDELEPFMDESIERLASSSLPVRAENDYLESMLAWEQAPVLPLSRWFEPELELPQPGSLSDDEMRTILWQTIQRLYEVRIILEHTDHLSDRELYKVICVDILTSREKKIDNDGRLLRWDCVDPVEEPLTWLTYYASDDERENWGKVYQESLPPRLVPPYPRELPGTSELT